VPRKTLLALVAAALLAGCSAPAKTAAPAASVADAPRMSIVGLVQDEAFNPVAGAHVALRLTNHTTTTDAGGNFRFDGLTVSAYLVDVNATGLENQTLTAEPRQGNSSVNFVLRIPTSLRPRTEVTHFRGFLQCASEELIISGSCDAIVVFANQPPVFNDTSIFQVGLGARWRSIVIDTDFAPQPGIDGLRITVSGLNDQHNLDNYQQYGRFHGSEPFTSRIDINGTYPDDTTGPVPANLTALQVQVFPQGFGWHATCQSPAPPDPQDCTLGVGAATQVDFDLFITVFYNQDAPDGYTLLPH